MRVYFEVVMKFEVKFDFRVKMSLLSENARGELEKGKELLGKRFPILCEFAYYFFYILDCFVFFEI